MAGRHQRAHARTTKAKQITHGRNAALTARADYRTILSSAEIRRMLLTAFLGRASLGMLGLGTVVYLHQQRHSYAVAGAVGGAVGFGIAISAVLQARIIRRWGRVSLIVFAGAYTLLAIALILGGAERWSPVLLTVFAFGLGLSVPATSPITRALYPGAVRHRPRLAPTLFALDSALTDATYVAGPALVSFTVAIASAGIAIGVGAITSVCSVVLLLTTDAAPLPGQATRMTRRTNLRHAGAVKVLALASFPVGLAFGVQEVAFPAFATAHHDPALSGVPLALIALASVVGGLAYGVFSHRVAAARLLVMGAVLYPVAFALPAIATAFTALCLLALPTGLVNGPWIAARNHFMNVASEQELRPAANAWALLFVCLGTASGLALGGVVVATAGWRTDLLVACAAAAGIPAMTLLSRGAFQDSAIASSVSCASS